MISLYLVNLDLGKPYILSAENSRGPVSFPLLLTTAKPLKRAISLRPPHTTTRRSRSLVVSLARFKLPESNGFACILVVVCRFTKITSSRAMKPSMLTPTCSLTMSIASMTTLEVSYLIVTLCLSLLFGNNSSNCLELKSTSRHRSTPELMNKLNEQIRPWSNIYVFIRTSKIIGYPCYLPPNSRTTTRSNVSRSMQTMDLILLTRSILRFRQDDANK